MTRRYRTLAAALTAATALTSCSLNLENLNTTPAPPTPIATPGMLNTTAPAITARTSSPTSVPPTTGIADQDPVDAGAPTNQTVLSNPTFDLDAIDLASPEQVAWAYLTERLSYSYRDTQPGAGVTRAARYLTPDAATQIPSPAIDLVPQDDDQWAAAVAAHTVATTTIARLVTFTPSPGPAPDSTGAGAEALVVAEWTRVLSNTTGTPLGHTGTTTLTLQLQLDNTWRIGNPGFDSAG